MESSVTRLDDDLVEIIWPSRMRFRSESRESTEGKVRVFCIAPRGPAEVG